jgi:hypothetical protein
MRYKMMLLVFACVVPRVGHALAEVPEIPANVNCIVKQSPTRCDGTLSVSQLHGIDMITKLGRCQTGLRVRLKNGSEKVLSLVKVRSETLTVAEENSGLGKTVSQMIEAARQDSEAELSLYDRCH